MLHLFAPKYGYDPEMIVQMSLGLPNWAEINAMPFMHTVVPNLCRLGLITERTESQWRAVGLMTDNRGASGSLPIVG
jgi:hypothetical protein